MLKTILIIVIFLSAMTIISNLIPQQLTASMDSAFVYFLGQINNLRVVSPTIVSAIFDITYVLGSYAVLVASWWAIRFMLNLIK